MGRHPGNTDVSNKERQRIRELFLDGVRFTDIVKLTGRSDAAVYDATKDLKRERPKPRGRRFVERNDQILAMVEQGRSRAEIGKRFGISPTQVNTIIVGHPYIAHLLRVERVRPAVVAKRYRMEVSTARRIAAGTSVSEIPRSRSGEWHGDGHHTSFRRRRRRVRT